MGHHYRPARFEDCREIAPLMRKQDAKEVMASSGLNPLRALQESFRISEINNSIIHEDGSVVGMFGLGINMAFASPWLLGTDKLLETRREFIPQAQKWVEEMNDEYPLLLNFVHESNTVSKRWLKSLGFEFIKLHNEYGVGREPFYQFVRMKKHV